MMVAVLFAQPDGVYSGLADVEIGMARSAERRTAAEHVGRE